MAFHHLDARAAQALMARNFGRAIAQRSALLADAPAVAGHVVRWLSDYQAIVRGPGGREQLASSNLPLATSGRNGVRSALNLNLVPTAGGFAPANPLHHLLIGSHLGGGVNVDGVRLTLQGGASTGSVVTRRSLFFSNVARDADAVESPTLDGGEVFEILRSRLSPETLRWRLAVPKGASVRQTATGLAISRSGHRLASIPWANAHDAQGQNVPVRMRLSGHELTLSVAHRHRDLAYPVLVDPTIIAGSEYTAPGATFETGVIDPQNGFQPGGGTPFYADEPGRIFGPSEGAYTTYQAARWSWPNPGGDTPSTLYYGYDFLLGPDGGPYGYTHNEPFFASISAGCMSLPLSLGEAGASGTYTVDPSNFPDECQDGPVRITTGVLGNGPFPLGMVVDVGILSINEPPSSPGGNGGGGGGGGGGGPIAQLAARFEPVLRFDSSEKWRPLNVEDFLAEGQHRICDSTGCDSTPLTSTGDLNRRRNPSAYIDIAGNFTGSGDEANFHSPYPECTIDGLRDCDSGDRSAIYWGMNDPLADGYTYLDYWFFYRANYFSGRIDFHEGDWEGVTVAPSSDGSTFDYAAFSQHGTYYSYLRNVLRCEDVLTGSMPAPGSCGPTSHRIDTMVANGSHANYTSPCSETYFSLVFSSCRQNGHPVAGHPVLAERGYDGQRLWGRAFDSSGTALLPLPLAGGTGWGDWPGLWGRKVSIFQFPQASGPASPENQAFNLDCAILNNDGGNNCPPRPPRGHTIGAPNEDDGGGGGGCDPCATRVHTSHPKKQLHSSPGLAAMRCSSWAGTGIAVAVCDPSRLRAAVEHARLGATTRASIAVAGIRGRTASAPGISQYASNRVLRSNSRLSIRGRFGKGKRVLVRAYDSKLRRVIVAEFEVRPLRGAVAAGARPLRVTLRLYHAAGRPVPTLGGRRAQSVRVVRRDG